MSKIKIKEGTIKQLDNNIEPKYDLHGLRQHLKSKGNKSSEETLPLTSMIDMFSMVIIFLIMNFSSEGDAYFVSRGVVLPVAQSADLLKNNPLVSILKDRIYLDAMPADKPRVELEEIEQPYPKLRQLLKEFQVRRMKQDVNQKPNLTVNIQADKNTDMIRIKEIMKLLLDEGWSGIHLAVKKSSDE